MSISARVCLMVLVVSGSGCYSPYPYGHGGYPGMYSAPMQGQPPAGAYLSPRDFTRLQAAGPNAQTFAGESQSWQIAGSSDAQAVPESQAIQDQNAVPDPQDLEIADDESNWGSESSDTGDQTGSETESDALKNGRDPFETEGFGSGSQRESPDSRSTVQLPFGHDEMKFRWLRGLAEYVEQDESWHIMYNDNPTDDRFGGEFTLANNAELDKLDKREMYFMTVDGQYDSKSLDQRGKPSYRITNIRSARKER